MDSDPRHTAIDLSVKGYPRAKEGPKILRYLLESRYRAGEWSLCMC